MSVSPHKYRNAIAIITRTVKDNNCRLSIGEGLTASVILCKTTQKVTNDFHKARSKTLNLINKSCGVL
jgi:hypothetical protein